MNIGMLVEPLFRAKILNELAGAAPGLSNAMRREPTEYDEGRFH
jgi:hypothetical protein